MLFLDGSQDTLLRPRTLFQPVTELFAEIQDKLPLNTSKVPLSHPSIPPMSAYCTRYCVLSQPGFPASAS